MGALQFEKKKTGAQISGLPCSPLVSILESSFKFIVCGIQLHHTLSGGKDAPWTARDIAKPFRAALPRAPYEQYHLCTSVTHGSNCSDGKVAK